MRGGRCLGRIWPSGSSRYNAAGLGALLVVKLQALMPGLALQPFGQVNRVCSCTPTWLKHPRSSGTPCCRVPWTGPLHPQHAWRV